jgi:N-acylglucosamine-6-phosphate 2-epimerase
MADCSNLKDGQRALVQGASILGTTLSGYTDETAGRANGVDFDLIRAFKALGAFVMAEGRVNTPDLAREAIAAGADAVTAGTALTRLEHVTGWFRDAVKAVAKA